MKDLNTVNEVEDESGLFLLYTKIVFGDIDESILPENIRLALEAKNEEYDKRFDDEYDELEQAREYDIEDIREANYQTSLK